MLFGCWVFPWKPTIILFSIMKIYIVLLEYRLLYWNKRENRTSKVLLLVDLVSLDPGKSTSIIVLSQNRKVLLFGTLKGQSLTGGLLLGSWVLPWKAWEKGIDQPQPQCCWVQGVAFQGELRVVALERLGRVHSYTAVCKNLRKLTPKYINHFI